MKKPVGVGTKILSVVVRLFAYLVYAAICVMTIMICVGTFIPYIAEYIAEMLHLTIEMPVIILAVNWGIPVAFASGFLFIIIYLFLRWVFVVLMQLVGLVDNRSDVDDDSDEDESKSKNVDEASGKNEDDDDIIEVAIIEEEILEDSSEMESKK